MMDKNNPLFDKNFPNWKKNLWGMLRAFVASFIPTAGVMLMGISAKDLNSLETAKSFILPVLIASFVAGIIGLGKFLRDIYPESKLVQKLPL